MPTLPNIIPLIDAHRFTQALIGDRAQLLGKLHQQKLPVVSGFIVPVNTFVTVFTARWQQIEYYLSQLDPHQPDTIHQTAQQIQKLIELEQLPDSLIHELVAAYQSLNPQDYALVKVSRCSTLIPYHSFTSVPFQGEANALIMLKQAWASFFSPAHLLNFCKRHVTSSSLIHAVIFHNSPAATKSGFAYTHHLDSNKKNIAVIEAVWGDTLASEELGTTSDHIEFHRFNQHILTSVIRPQFQQKALAQGELDKIEVPFARRYKAKLTPTQLNRLGQLIIQVHRLFFFPRRIHWHWSKIGVYIDDCEPDESAHNAVAISTLAPPLLKGVGVTLGKATGKVKYVLDIVAAKSLQRNQIAVLPRWDKHLQPYLQRGGGVIIENYASPQDVGVLRVPVLTGAYHATSLLMEGQNISLDTSSGTVYEDQHTKPLPHFQEKQLTQGKPTLQVFLSTGEPEHLSPEIMNKVAGIGLLRAEYLFASVGVHPQQLLRQNKQEVLIRVLTRGIMAACALDRTKPVIYRCSDFDSQELRELKGGEEYEPKEDNPLTGYRGAYRYLTRVDEFDLELTAIKRVRDAGYTNLDMMFPFVRSVDEYVLLTHHLAKFGLQQSESFRFWIMVDTPSTALNIEQYFKAGIGGICVGARDLLTLLTGSSLQHDSHFTQVYLKDPAFFSLLEKMGRAAQQAQKPILFCEHAVTSRELLEFLETHHFTGVSVSKKSLHFVLENSASTHLKKGSIK